MSYDYDILRPRESPGPLGTPSDVWQRVSRALLSADISSGRLVGPDWVMEISLARRSDGPLVDVLHVRPRGRIATHDGPPQVLMPLEQALEAIATALDASVFDPQTGRFRGDPPPPVEPDRAEGYIVEFCAVTAPMGGTLGSPQGVWSRLALHLGVSEVEPRIQRAGWNLEATLSIDQKREEVSRVAVRAGWEDRSARLAVFRLFRRLSDGENWVPFDPQRNDTVDFDAK